MRNVEVDRRRAGRQHQARLPVFRLLDHQVLGRDAGLAPQNPPQRHARGHETLAVFLETVTRGPLAFRRSQDFTCTGKIEGSPVDDPDMNRVANTSVPSPRSRVSVARRAAESKWAWRAIC